jgi:two-component system OmpR family response regulator
MAPPINRILLVEDDPDIQMVAGISLESVGGFTVRICCSGREALEAAPGFSPDLFILDVMMPEMDGPATLKALRAIPELAGVPAVFMTAKVQPSEVTYYLQLGAADVIAKPFDPMTLPGTVRGIWERIHPTSP